MMNKKIGIILLVLCFCLHLIPCGVQAASTSDAIEPITPNNTCSLTVSYCYGETAFSDVQVKLYRIAEISADFQYTLTQPFKASGLVLNGVQSIGEWNVIRSTIEAHILAYDVEPDAVSATNQNGQVCFDALSTGMYLAVVSLAAQGDLQCRFDSALVTLPGLGQDGRWQYEVSVNAKGEALPPVDSDEEIEFKVLKLWKGDEGRSDRPESIEVEIFRNGISYEKIVLSEENHWSYAWSAEDDGANWSVVERNVPEGYTVTVEAKDSSFVLTNVFTNPGQDDPVTPPETGDTANLMLYVLLMTISGTILILLGVTRKRMHI